MSPPDPWRGVTWIPPTRAKRREFSLAIAIAGLSILLANGPAVAQRPLEPGQIERRIERPAPPKKIQRPVVPAPRAEPSTRIGADRFLLTGLDIRGATVFRADELAPLYEELLGKAVSAVEIERILKRITAKYRKAGYVLTRAIAPIQDARLGIVTIQVVEGFVARIRFTGDDPGRRDLFEAYAKKILASRPLHLDELERNILLMNDLPGLTVKPRLRELDKPSGGFELTVDIKHRAVGAGVSLDNRGTTANGPFQAFATVSFNSVFGFNEETRISIFAVPDDPKELLYFNVFHEQRVGAQGTRAFVSGSYSKIDTTNDFGERTEGRGENFSVGVTHPFVRLRRRSVFGTVRFDASRFEQRAIGNDFDDQLRVLRLGGRYAARDSWEGVNGLGLEVSRGFDALASSDADSNSLSRSGGDPDFTKVAMDASRTQPFGMNWFVSMTVAGQWSPDVLLSSEEFTLGGRQFGRGYDPAELSASKGAGGVIEAGYKTKIGKTFFRSFQVYGFGDGGAVWFNDDTSQGLASAGVGIRIELLDGINAEIEWAKPLIRDVANEGDRDGRIFFTLSGRL